MPKAGFLAVALVLLLLIPARAFAVTQVWDGGCGEDHSWSCAGNWKRDVVPAPGDTVAFNARSTGVSTVDAGFGGKVAAVRLLPGYSGTVILDRSLTVSKSFMQRDGQFAAGGHALAVQTLLLFGGAFEASSTTTSVAATLKVSGSPEFDANGGTLVVEGTGGRLVCDGIELNRVVLANTAKTKTVEPSCDLPLGNDPDAGAGGSIELNGTLSGSGTLSSAGLLTLGATGGLSGFSALDADRLTVAGSYDFGGYSSLSVAETFLLKASGGFTAPAGTASFGGRFKIPPAAEFDANGGMVVFDGAANSSIFCGNKAFNLVRFEQTAVKNVERDCTLPLGSDPTLGGGAGATVRLTGSLSGSGTLAVDGSLTLTRPSRLSGFAGLEAGGDLEVLGATPDFGSYSPFSVGGTYSQTAGKAVAPGGADFSGAFELGPRASFEAPSGAMAVGGDFAVDREAAFDANGGTVVLDGGDQRLDGAMSFDGLSKVGAATLAFAAGDTVTVNGMLTLRGASPTGLLRLASSSPGTPWRIDPRSSRQVRLVSVMDSTNLGAAISAYSSVIGSGNTGWVAASPSVPGGPTTSKSPTKDGTPLFTWAESTEGGLAAAGYEVQWSMDGDFESGAISDSTATAPSCAISTTVCGGSGGLEKGKWYVRVRSFDQLGHPSEYSEAGEVRIVG